MYSKKIMDVFVNPSNMGEIKKADGLGKIGNTVCGDVMYIYLKIEDDVIVDAKFKTFGCVAAIVSSNIACDLIKGKTLDEAKKVTNKQVLELLGEVPANKIHCSILAQEAIENAIADYYKKRARAKNKK